MTPEPVHRGGFFALTPLLVFLACYLAVSILAGDFYKMPISVAFVFASVYAVATNLFTVTDWPGIDPESTGTGTTAGTNYDSYPLSKTFSVGVKLSF